jgi:hypothetical protein
VFLINGVGASEVVLDLFTIGGLEGAEHTDVTRLKFIRCMGGQAAKNNVVLEAELQHLHGLMCCKAVVDENLRLAISSGPSERVKGFLGLVVIS